MIRNLLKSSIRKHRFLIAAGQAFATIAYFLGGMRPLIKEEQKSAQIMDDRQNGSAPRPDAQTDTEYSSIIRTNR